MHFDSLPCRVIPFFANINRSIPVKSFLHRNPVLTYFALTFAISWGGMLIVARASGMPATPEQAERLFPIALVLLLLSPFLSGILLNLWVYGKNGLRELLSSAWKWQVRGKWYAIALLGIPILVLATLLVLSMSSEAYLPAIVTTGDPVGLLLSGIAVGLLGGIFEETGWTGFAIPELRKKYSIFQTGLIVGLLWGIWHVLITFWASGDASGELSWPLFLPPFLFYVAVLPVARVLMVWVYAHTKSLLMMILMHAGLTASTLFILQPAATDSALSMYYVILAALIWMIVAGIAITNKWNASNS